MLWSRGLVAASLAVAGATALACVSIPEETSTLRDESSAGTSSSSGAGTSGTATQGGAGGSSTSTGGSGGMTSSTGGMAGTGGTSSAGTSSSGGTAGSNGTTCQPDTGDPADLVISDLESGNAHINAPREGFWVNYVEGMVAVDPPIGSFLPTNDGTAAGGSWYAHVTGGAGNTVVGLSILLNNNCTHDVSAYTGVTFHYKSAHTVLFGVGTTATIPPPYGTCVASSSDPCYNSYAITFAPAMAWTQVTVKWPALEQQFGVKTDWDPSQVIDLHFDVNGVWNQTTGVTEPIVGSVDLAIDEVYFTLD